MELWTNFFNGLAACFSQLWSDLLAGLFGT